MQISVLNANINYFMADQKIKENCGDQWRNEENLH